MAFKMKGSPFQQMESNAQQRKNLMNDNPVDSKASALNKMDPMHNGEPGVQKEDFEQFSSPMNQGEKKIPFIKKKNVIRTPRSKKKITKSKLEEERNTRKQNFREENQITAKSLRPKDGKKKKSPLNNKEERKAKRAKRREETGGTRIGNAIRKGKEVVDKVKNSKVGKVASGIVKTVSNVKSGRIGAAIESGKQTISDAKKKKADSPATMKKSKY